MWNDLVKDFKVSGVILSEAVRKGLLKTRTRAESKKLSDKERAPQKHSPETKALISRRRREYLTRMGKSAWSHHAHHVHFDSVPCKRVKDYLTEIGCLFEEEHQPLRHKKRFFAIDIAFPLLKIGWEINGGQHYDGDNKLKPYYQNRHDLIEAEGWKLIEIPYRKAFDKTYIDSLVKEINDEMVLRVGYDPTT